ncbi:MAG: AraC family transcriptional regulator [Verrucomicrobiae bacterium]|nr:AraC family transcriptional regulator [Verrucomicrobiae bacterium]
MIFDLSGVSPHVRRTRINRNRGQPQAYVDPDYVFTLILQGGGIFRLEGRKCRIQRGHLILMPPYMMHVVEPQSGGEITQFVIHFDLFFNPKRTGTVHLKKGMDFREFCRQRNNPETLLTSIPPVVMPPEADQIAIEKLFPLLKKDLDTKPPGFELSVKARMLDILSIYLKNTSRQIRSQKTPSKGWRNIEKAIRFIHMHHKESLPLLKISREAGLSLNYFCNLFKARTGTSIHRYINGVRIREAKRLIEESRLNFSQIADAVGFPTIHLFSRIFKKIEGMTPTEYASAKHGPTT